MGRKKRKPLNDRSVPKPVPARDGKGSHCPPLDKGKYAKEAALIREAMHDC
jgi:hypothetical protein